MNTKILLPVVALLSLSTLLPAEAFAQSLELAVQSAFVDLVGDESANPGDEIRYTLVVTNTGAVALDDITVFADVPLDDPFAFSSLDPSESATATATFVLTQADVDATSHTNTVRVSGSCAGCAQLVEETQSETLTLPVRMETDLSVASSWVDHDSDGAPSLGDDIVYTFSVCNLGNRTLSTVRLTAVQLNLGTDSIFVALAPGVCGASQAALTVLQEDLDAGFIEVSVNALSIAGNGDISETSVTHVTSLAVDSDGDGVPDSDDPCTGNPNVDSDGDGACDTSDVCPTDASDTDDDNDNVCDVVDVCVGLVNVDSDGDQICDDLDLCEGIDATGDSDSDGLCDANDNCPEDINPDQTDADSDLIGDACEADGDLDGVVDDDDNCPAHANTDQTDADLDGAGDVCDADDDNDLIADAVDNCPLYNNPNQIDGDGDGFGDECDGDDDADGVADDVDACPGTPIGEPFDIDGCSGPQRVELTCGVPSDFTWNKGLYVRCVVREARSVWRSGLIIRAERSYLIRRAIHRVWWSLHPPPTAVVLGGRGEYHTQAAPHRPAGRRDRRDRGSDPARLSRHTQTSCRKTPSQTSAIHRQRRSSSRRVAPHPAPSDMSPSRLLVPPPAPTPSPQPRSMPRAAERSPP